MGVALAVIELVTPAWLDTLAGDPERAALAYAVLATVGFAADALGATLAPVARRRLRTPARASAAATSVALAGLLGLVVASLGGDAAGLLVAGVAYVGVFIGLGLGAAGPPMGELLHGQVRSEQRATVLSVQSLMFQLAGAAGSILAGSLTVWHGPPPAGFAVAAVSLAVAIPMLLWLHAHGSHPPTPRDRRSQDARSRSGTTGSAAVPARIPL